MHPSIYSPQEDSHLIQQAIKKTISKLKPRQKENFKVLEIGPGSGIQLQTLNKLKIPKENIFALEINPQAVKHCKKMGFNCTHSNLFEKAPKEKFNLIIFNPPYLPEDKQEPKDSKLATTGGKTGSEIINKFLKQSKKYLAKDGRILLLTSSLTKKIQWNNFRKRLINKKKLFFEELKVYELKIKK